MLIKNSRNCNSIKIKKKLTTKQKKLNVTVGARQFRKKKKFFYKILNNILTFNLFTF